MASTISPVTMLLTTSPSFKLANSSSDIGTGTGQADVCPEIGRELQGSGSLPDCIRCPPAGFRSSLVTRTGLSRAIRRRAGRPAAHFALYQRIPGKAGGSCEAATFSSVSPAQYVQRLQQSHQGKALRNFTPSRPNESA